MISFYKFEKILRKSKESLFEVGAGGGGPGSGMSPPKQNPLVFTGAFQDYHGNDSKDSKNPHGKLPPIKKIKK
jgi:hypothetical protein